MDFNGWKALAVKDRFMSDAVGAMDHLLGSIEQWDAVRTDLPDPVGAPVEALGSTGMAAGTRILTPCGAVRVDQLRPGDLVMTCDNGFVPLRKVRLRAEQPHFLRFQKQALGAERRVDLAPRQLVLLQSAGVRATFGVEDVLVEARALQRRKNVRRMVGPSPPMWTLETERQEILFANGLKLVTAAANRTAPAARMILTQAEAMLVSGARWTG